MSEILANVGQFSLEVVSRGGYAGVFLLSFLDRAAMSFIPAEVVFPVVGFLTGQGRFAFWVIMATSTLGGLLGDWLIYFLSFKFGRGILDKYGKYFFISRHDLNHVDRLFTKHGGKLVLVGRFMPIARAFVAIPAGISRMPVKQFLLYTTIGSLPANFLFLYVGVKTGENWRVFQPYLQYLDLMVLATAFLAFLWYVYRHWKKKHFSHD